MNNEQNESTLLSKLEAATHALECIVAEANAQMGDWAFVSDTYLPNEMMGLHELREIARESIAAANAEQPAGVDVAYVDGIDPYP